MLNWIVWPVGQYPRG